MAVVVEHYHTLPPVVGDPLRNLPVVVVVEVAGCLYRTVVVVVEGGQPSWSANHQCLLGVRESQQRAY